MNSRKPTPPASPPQEPDLPGGWITGLHGPTEEMIEAYFARVHELGFHACITATAAWLAFRSAAPQPPGGVGEAVASTGSGAAVHHVLEAHGVFVSSQEADAIAEELALPALDHGVVREAVEYAADVRWLELAQGSPFGIIDRKMLAELYARGRRALYASLEKQDLANEMSAQSQPSAEAGAHFPPSPDYLGALELREIVADALSGFRCTQRPGHYPADHWSNRAVAALAKRSSTEAAEVDQEESRCIACAKPMKPGDLYLLDVSGGPLHFDCCGPEPECYVDLDTGEPLGHVPEPLIWDDPAQPHAPTASPSVAGRGTQDAPILPDPEAGQQPGDL